MSLCSAQLTHGPAEELTCHLPWFHSRHGPQPIRTAYSGAGSWGIRAGKRTSEQASLAGGDLVRLCEPSLADVSLCCWWSYTYMYLTTV